jgi:ClpP class serine protease
MGSNRKARLYHVESLVYGTPLAVSRQRLETICEVLEQRDDPAGLDAAAPSLRADASDDAVRITPDGIAVLPLLGTFTKRAGMMDAMSGLQSYAAIGTSLRALVDNPQVRAIVLQIDSPGGQVAGAFELAAELRAAGKKKPVWAVADENALSAAYLLASAAARVLVSADRAGSAPSASSRRGRTSPKAEREGRARAAPSSSRRARSEAGRPPVDVAPTDAEMARLKAKVDQMGALLRR